MALTGQKLEEVEARMAESRSAGRAVSARYDRHRGRVVVALHTGVKISPAGLGLHWPQLNADLYVPALMQGVFGSEKWMAKHLGAPGGRARTPAKVAAARANGRKGGWPRKSALDSSSFGGDPF